MRVGLRGNQTCCQLILLQEHSVGHTQLGKVVLGLAAEAANVFINIIYYIYRVISGSCKIVGA